MGLSKGWSGSPLVTTTGPAPSTPVSPPEAVACPEISTPGSEARGRLPELAPTSGLGPSEAISEVAMAGAMVFMG